MTENGKQSTVHIWIASLAVSVAAVAIIFYVFANILVSKTEQVVGDLGLRVENLAVAQNLRLDTLIDRLQTIEQLNQRLRSLEAAIPYRPAPVDPQAAGATDGAAAPVASPDATAPAAPENTAPETASPAIAAPETAAPVAP